MKNLEEIKQQISEHKEILKEKFAVKEIGIFGSYVRGEYEETSDLDILVEFSKPIDFFKFLDLEEYLERLLDVKVDLVMKKVLKPAIGRYILDEVVYV
ncbi:MAG: nucleotidyltransferase family protein [Nitrospirae bacterium]|nr:nucleotidyltransferase family protein [Nitrospirota bacterium]